MPDWNPELIAKVRDLYPQMIAEELCSVQPIENFDFVAVWEAIERMRAYRRSLGIHCCNDGDSRNLRRDTNPGLAAVERFYYKRKPTKPLRHKLDPTIKDVREKVRSFRRREGSKVAAIKDGPIFTYHRMLETYQNKPSCYLTERAIDLMDTNTYSLDHIVPATRGGDNSFENMGLTCPQANWAKSDMTVKEFIQLCSEVVEHFGGKFAVRPND